VLGSNLKSKEENMTDSINEKLEKYNGVEGWLFLLCQTLIIISPIATLFNLFTGYYKSFLHFDKVSGLQNLFYVDSFISVLLMGLSIRAGIALAKIKPGAVEIAKNFILISLLYSFTRLSL
jgi:hypothetical protein